jgi:peptidoglycan/xylan/chitin deacetylase (PgdA/CDA1 family)
VRLFLSHDVDWPRSGPGREHILARRNRFDSEIVKRVESAGFNPYYGVAQMMKIEESLDVKSTFFFRPEYDNGEGVEEYRADIKNLLDGGWEVGVHLNDASSNESITVEKKRVDDVAGQRTAGTRVHYLRIPYNDIGNLRLSGFLYDSSLCYSKDAFDERNADVFKIGDVTEMPITFMDAYLFSYMGLVEATVVPYIVSKINELKERKKVCTLLWHDNVIYMRGGRKYEDLLKSIVSISGVDICRGVDILNNLNA